MPSRANRVTESQIGLAVLVMLSKCPHQTATVKYLKDNITAHIVLTSDDQEFSLTRDNEELWEQQVRNLKSHSGAEGNIFTDGMVESASRGVWTLTEAGAKYIKTLGL